MQTIKYIFSDVDGVLTDGKVIIDTEGTERKSICYRDLDAVGIGRKAGLEFAFITGEDTDLARFIAKRFKVEKVIFGAKDKFIAIKNMLKETGVAPQEVCYIGDSNRDIPAIEFAGIGIAPADGSNKAKAAADYIAESNGGTGVLLEVVENIIARRYERNQEDETI